jgi:hypothetical protein
MLLSIEHLPFRRVNKFYINGPLILLVHDLSRNVFIALSALVPNLDVSRRAVSRPSHSQENGLKSGVLCSWIYFYNG